MELYLYVSSLVQAFEIFPEDGQPRPDLQRWGRVVLPFPAPFSVQLVPRKVAAFA